MVYTKLPSEGDLPHMLGAHEGGFSSYQYPRKEPITFILWRLSELHLKSKGYLLHVPEAHEGGSSRLSQNPRKEEIP